MTTVLTVAVIIIILMFLLFIRLIDRLVWVLHIARSIREVCDATMTDEKKIASIRTMLDHLLR